MTSQLCCLLEQPTVRYSTVLYGVIRTIHSLCKGIMLFSSLIFIASLSVMDSSLSNVAAAEVIYLCGGTVLLILKCPQFPPTNF